MKATIHNTKHSGSQRLKLDIRESYSAVIGGTNKEMWQISKSDILIISELLSNGEHEATVAGILRALVIFEMEMPGFFEAFSQIVKRVSFRENQRYETIDELLEESTYFKQFKERSGYSGVQYFSLLFERFFSQNDLGEAKSIVQMMSETMSTREHAAEPKREMHPAGEVERRINEARREGAGSGKGAEMLRIMQNIRRNRRGFVKNLLKQGRDDEADGRERERTEIVEAEAVDEVPQVAEAEAVDDAKETSVSPEPEEVTSEPVQVNTPMFSGSVEGSEDINSIIKTMEADVDDEGPISDIGEVMEQHAKDEAEESGVIEIFGELPEEKQMGEEFLDEMNEEGFEGFEDEEKDAQ